MASELIRYEVQVLRVASGASNSSSDSIAGNFRLSWGEEGEETDYLPADVGEVELKAALEALVEVREVQVRDSSSLVFCRGVMYIYVCDVGGGSTGMIGEPRRDRFFAFRMVLPERLSWSYCSSDIFQ